MLYNIENLKTAFRVEISKVFEEMIEVLLNSGRFQWIVEQELSEYLRAYPTSGLRERCDHKVLYSFHQVI